MRPNEAIQWYAMRYWKQHGIRFYDMGGAGSDKAKFGGAKIMVPWIWKSRLRVLSGLRRVGREAISVRRRTLGISSL